MAKYCTGLKVVGLGYSSIIYSDDDAADETLTSLVHDPHTRTTHK